MTEKAQPSRYDDGKRATVRELVEWLTAWVEDGKGDYDVMVTTYDASAPLRFIRFADPGQGEENDYGVVHLAEGPNECWYPGQDVRLPLIERWSD